MSGRRRPMFTTETTYRLAIGLAALVSIGGVLCTGFFSNDKDNGGRGGAVAVIVSLSVFFLRRNYSDRVIDSTLELFPELAQHLENIANGLKIVPFTSEETTELLLGLFGRMNVESGEQHDMNIALFWTSLIGTVFWGFGDIPAGLMIQYRLHH